MSIEFSTPPLAVLFVVMSIVFSTVAQLLMPRLGYEWCALRRVPALDVFEEAVRICAEKARPLFQSTGTTTIRASGQQFTESICALGGWFTRRCAELGVRFIVCVAGGTRIHMMLYDFARENYAVAGHPEMFRPEDIIYTVSDGATMENFDIIREEKPGAFIGIGHFGAGHHVPYFERAVVEGSFIVGSSYWPDESSQASLASDYTLMGPEQQVAGAYIENDPGQMAAFIGEDLVKLYAIVCLLVGGIVYMLTGDVILG